MNYCDKCAIKNNYPGSSIRVFDKCELCGQLSDCNSVKDSQLLKSKPKVVSEKDTITSADLAKLKQHFMG